MERHFHGGLEGSWTFVARASRTEHLKAPKLLRYQAGDLQRPPVLRLVRARSLQRRGLRRRRLVRRGLLRGPAQRAHRYRGLMRFLLNLNMERTSYLELLSASLLLSYPDQFHVMNVNQPTLSLTLDLPVLKEEKRGR